VKFPDQRPAAFINDIDGELRIVEARDAQLADATQSGHNRILDQPIEVRRPYNFDSLSDDERS
jgi:hypothetical protein